MKKRLLSMILAISMVLTFLPVSAVTAFAADNNTCGDGLTWSLSDDGVLTISKTGDGSGEMSNYSSAYPYRETAPWYDQRSKITQVKIENGVVSIGNAAFFNCDKLTNVEIPASVASIGNYAFSSCTALTGVEISTSVMSIGENAFESTGLTSVKIPNSVTSVGDSAFRSCSGLTSIDIQNAVIGRKQFYNCKALTTVTIPDTVTTWGEYAFENCTGLKTVTLEDGATSIGDYAFFNALTTKEDGSDITVTIPNSVTTIGKGAFSGCTGLKAITLPSDITAISDGTFSGSGLTKIEIPSKVTSIGYRAFAQCISLLEASISDKVTTIDRQAFSGCTNLLTVNIPNGLETIDESTFKNCTALKSIVIPTSVKTIGASAFEGSGLQHLVIPEGVTKISTDAFKKCLGLIDVSIPKTVNEMGGQYGSAFQGCTQLQKVEFKNPGSLTLLGADTFNGCVALNDVTLPSSLNNIRPRAFNGCINLETLALPSMLYDIDANAFENCTSLKELSITYTGSKYIALDTDAFKGCSQLGKIYYSGSLDNLKKFGTSNIKGLTVLDTGDTQIVYDGQTPIDLVYQCNVEFYTKADNSSYYSHMYGKDVNVYHNETLASDKAPTLESKEGYTLRWRVGSADGEEFVFGETPVTADMKLYAVYTLNTKGVTVTPGVTVKDADGNTINPDGSGNVSVTPGQEITLSPTTKNDGDAYEWTISGNGSEQPETKTGDSITITVSDETNIKLETLKALHITADEGKPDTTDTKYDATSGTYYGNGWEYSQDDGLTIKADKDLSKEPAVKVAVTVAENVKVSNARLTGGVTNNGTLSNCVLDKAPNGGTVEDSLFGAEYTNAKTLTEADGNEITAALKGVDGSLTGTKLWFVGSPNLTATVENNTAIKHINHKAVNETGITGIAGTVETNSTNHSVTFTPDGTADILLNNRTAKSGDFTFTTPDGCTYDDKVHKVENINSTTYKDDEYTVRYDYVKKDGSTGTTEEPKDAGTYTVKIVMSDGQTITTNESFTIKPAEPGKGDFDAKLPSGVTEDRDDSEKTAEVQLKSDSLFQKNGTNVEQEYQKKNDAGKWEKVTAPSGKGEYRLVATVTTTDPNLTGGTVEWEFTILDREDANWLTMSVEDGKITKVTRPAEDAEEDITEKVLLTASADGSKTAYKVPAGAQVTVTANDAPQDMKFEMWRFSVNSMNGDTTLALYSRSMTFTLKDDFAGLTVSAMYQDAAIDSGYDILGPAAAATTAVVGSAILAYQGHMLGTELYLIYLLPSGAVIPANRIQLAMLLWQDAGNPAPVDETPYSDIDSGDTDAMQAAQWAVETGLMELPDADNAPDQFDPYAAVSNVDVIHAWKKAQKVKG